MIKAHEIKLIDILPAILKNDKTMAAIAKVLQKYIDENYVYIEKLNILTNIDNITNEELVDHLAYQLHVDFYDSSLDIDKKKKLVENSIPQHRKKGTPIAIENLIEIVFGSGKVEEWFEYNGEPYYFRILTENKSATQERAEEFIRAVNTVKNTRSHLESVIIISSEEMNLYFGGFVHVGSYDEYRQVK